MISILICDDQDIVCQGLRVILNNSPDMEVVGIAYNGAEALTQIAERQPDLVLMDLKMPIMNGIQATRQIREKYPAVQVLVLTTYDADEWVFDAIRSGAAGYLLKATPAEQLVAAVRDTVAGKTHVDPDVAGKLFTQISQQHSSTDTTIAADLNRRERDILSLLARGLSNPDIARRLHLSDGTVRNYVSAIFTKLGVTDRTQAAILALRHGLANTEP
ncbi:MAG: response regulator transcription factor [Chloroflexota bacterium]